MLLGRARSSKTASDRDGSCDGRVTLEMPSGWQKVSESSKFNLVFNLLLSPKVREAVLSRIQATMGLELVSYRNAPAAGDKNGGQLQIALFQNLARGGDEELHHTYLRIMQKELDPDAQTLGAQTATNPVHCRIVRQWTCIERRLPVGSSGSTLISSEETRFTAEQLQDSNWFIQEQEVRLQSDEDGNINATFIWKPPERGDLFPGTDKDFRALLPKFSQGQRESLVAIKAMFMAWAASRKDKPPLLKKESTWGTLRTVAALTAANRRGRHSRDNHEVDDLKKIPDAESPVTMIGSDTEHSNQT